MRFEPEYSIGEKVYYLKLREPQRFDTPMDLVEEGEVRSIEICRENSGNSEFYLLYKVGYDEHKREDAITNNYKKAIEDAFALAAKWKEKKEQESKEKQDLEKRKSEVDLVAKLGELKSREFLYKILVLYSSEEELKKLKKQIDEKLKKENN